MDGSGLLKDAFLAVAGCIVVHGIFDAAMMISGGGFNPWVVSNWVRDGLTYAFGAVAGDPVTNTLASIASEQAAEHVGEAALEHVAESTAEHVGEEVCHAHLGGEIHCGPGH